LGKKKIDHQKAPSWKKNQKKHNRIHGRARFWERFTFPLLKRDTVNNRRKSFPRSMVVSRFYGKEGKTVAPASEGSRGPKKR